METDTKSRLILFLCFLLCFIYIPIKEYNKAKNLVIERQRADSLSNQTKRFDYTIKCIMCNSKKDTVNIINR